MTEPALLPAVILAGGLSRRMGGGDKFLRDLDGQSLLARVIARIGQQAGPVAINANGDPSRLSDFGLPVIADSVPDHPGPLAGVLAGMDWAAAFGAARIVTVAADTPFLPADLVERLVAGAGHAPVAIAATRRAEGEGFHRHPTTGLWSTALRDDLRAALAAGVRKVGFWAERQGSVYVPFDTAGGDPFFNVNTPDDLAAARTEALRVRPK